MIEGSTHRSLYVARLSPAALNPVAHPQFSNAIEDYLSEEGKHVDRYIDAVDAHTPYKNPEDES